MLFFSVFSKPSIKKKNETQFIYYFSIFIFISLTIVGSLNVGMKLSIFDSNNFSYLCVCGFQKDKITSFTHKYVFIIENNLIYKIISATLDATILVSSIANSG